jgi:hypothetical protein
VKTKYILTLSLLLLTFPLAYADEDFIGAAVRVDEGGFCFVYMSGFQYEGSFIVQYSNSKMGHATYKCKLELTDGIPTILFFEGPFKPEPIKTADSCWTTISLEGKKGMLTGQCFGVWEEGS